MNSDERENKRKALLDSMEVFRRPVHCEQCGGVLIYQGVGEYACEECGNLQYDDYGKVRNYIEKHKGANMSEVSDMTGVSHNSIREMLRENRFEVTDVREGFLRCELCGESLASGRFCTKCETQYHRRLEEKARAERIGNSSVKGYSAEVEKSASGTIRFVRKD